MPHFDQSLGVRWDIPTGIPRLGSDALLAQAKVKDLVALSATVAGHETRIHNLEPFATLSAISGASVAPSVEVVTTLRRDTSSLFAPAIYRAAGLSNPPHTLFSTAADGRRFEYAESVVNCQKIGMSPERDALQNFNLLEEALDYAYARGVPVYLPGAAEPYYLRPDTYMIMGRAGESKLSIIGDGFGLSTLKVAAGPSGGGASFSDMTYVSLLDLTFDCNWPHHTGVTGYHGLRLQDVKDGRFRLQILDTGSYGIGAQAPTTPFKRLWFEQIDIRRTALDGIDFKNTNADVPGTNGEIFFQNIYIEDPNLGRLDNDGAGLDIRGRAMVGQVSVIFKSYASCGVGFRTREYDAITNGPGGRYTQIDSISVIDEAVSHAYLTSGVEIADRHVKLSKAIVLATSSYGFQIGASDYCVLGSCTASNCGGGFFIHDSCLNLSIISPRAVGCADGEGFRIEGAVNLKIIDGVAWACKYGFRTVGTPAENIQFLGCDAIDNLIGDWAVASPTARFWNCLNYMGDIFIFAANQIQASFAGNEGSTNWVEMGGVAPGGDPYIKAEGPAADLDLILAPKGNGAFRLNTPIHPLAGETISGYITIKDADAVPHKLAIIS